MAVVEQALERAAHAQKDHRRGEASFFDIFDGTGKAGGQAEGMPDVPEWPENQLLAMEKALLGFYVSGHPLGRFEKEIKQFATADAKTLPGLKGGATVRMGGIITKLRLTYTRRKNEKMAIATLEDLTGTVELLVYPRAYEKVGAQIVEEAALLVTGRVDVEEESPKLIVSDVVPLTEAQQQYTTAMHISIYLSDVEHGRLEDLKKLLLSSAGTCPVILDFTAGTGECVVMRASNGFRVTPTAELVQGVEALLGESSVRLTGENPKSQTPNPKFQAGKMRNGEGAI